MEKFFQLSHHCVITQKLQEIINTSPELFFTKYNFELMYVPDNILKLDETISHLRDKFDGVAVVMKMKPYLCNKWHIDSFRKCAINLLLSGPNSHCYFANTDAQDNMAYDVHELLYEPGRYYVFNTQKFHTIINHADPRYLFSVGFNNFSYQEVLEYCQNNNL